MLIGEQIGIPEVTDLSQLGVWGFFLWQLTRLVSRVHDFLDSTRAHQEKVREHLAELVIAVRRGVPPHVERDPTPIRGIDTRGAG